MQSLRVAEAHCGKSWVHSIFQEFCHRWLSFLRWVFCSPGWAGTHYVSENDLELIIDIDIYITLIPPLSARIISMHHHVLYAVLGIKLKALYVQDMHYTELYL